MNRTIFLIMLLSFNPTMTVAQECNESMVVDTPNERFLDQGNGTVIDNNTGLMWKKCSEGQSYNAQTRNCDGVASLYVSNEALAFAENINSTGFAGHTDWRVPNVKELSSIIESSCVNPAININVFKNTPSGPFRTSTPVGYNRFYCIHFANGEVKTTCDPVQGGSGMGGGMGAPDVYEGYLRFVRGK